MISYFVVSFKDGKRTYNFHSFENEKELFTYFFNRNSPVLYFTKIPINLSISKTKLRKDEIIEIIDTLHLIIKSGLPIHTGLVDLANDIDKKNFKNVLLYISEMLSMGHSLSYAMSKFPRIFNSMILTLIKVGESSGQLDLTLETASIYLKKYLSITRKVKQALIYPAFALVGSIAAMFVWMFSVLPQMIDLFKQMHVDLPAMTLFLISATDFLSKNGLFILIVILSLILIFSYSYMRNYNFNFFINKLLLRIPVVKQVISGYNISMIMDYLRLSVASGIPLFTALNTLYENTSNLVYKKAIDEIRAEVISGKSLSSAFKKTGLFNSFVIRMLSTGEESGNLDRQMIFVSEAYTQKVFYYAENIGKIIEPVIIIFVGIFMAFIMMSLITPIYDLISKLS